MSSLSLPIPAPTGGRGLALITALGITQVAGYGGLYYAFAVLAPKMTESFGWSPEWTYGGFAVGLLIGGLVAPAAGRLIDHYGTRLMMTLGSVLAGLSLFGLAAARGPVGYFAAMIALEIVSTLVLYDAAFTALTQARGPGARRAISQLTLIGGFASTLFWPLTTALLNSFDWRDIYRIYAVVQIALCAPLHLLLLPGPIHRTVSSAPRAYDADASQVSYLEGNARRSAFALLALAFSLQGFVMSAMSVHMLALLQGLGLSAAVAVGIGAMVGPSQVAGRLVEMLFGTSIDPVTTAWTCARR